MLEEKLQVLFSIFLSKLSETVETIPGTLLESCVYNFKEILNISILDIFREEFMSQLRDHILSQVREGTKEKLSIICSELEPLRNHIDERIDSAQDPISTNES